MTSSGATPSPAVGDIWLDVDFLEDRGSKRKYFLVLAVNRFDVTVRVFTTKPKGRPTTPACFHGLPFEGYYCGIIGGAMSRESWLCLDDRDDVDDRTFAQRVSTGRYQACTERLPRAVLCGALRCAANSGNTQKRQCKGIMDSVSALACP